MTIHRPPFTIHHFASLGSTNDQLKAMAAAPEFTCVVSDEQTAGRGRRARTWYSTPGDGLYLSILFLPRSDYSSRLPLIGLLAAVAVAETLIERGVADVARGRGIRRQATGSTCPFYFYHEAIPLRGFR